MIGLEETASDWLSVILQFLHIVGIKSSTYEFSIGPGFKGMKCDLYYFSPAY